MDKKFEIKTYSFSELAARYEVCVRTLKKEIIRAKVDIVLNPYKKTFMPLEVQKIVEKLGEP